MTRFIKIFFVLVTILLVNPAGASTKSVAAVRIESLGIRIDGHLDDSDWISGIFASDFIQRNPLEGEQATENTEFGILYDDEYLYIGIKAYSTDPNTIRSILSRCDEETPSDWLFVSLDSYNDNRTAFEFGLNPIGVKRDLRRFDDENSDTNWDANWEGESSRFENGWSAEFKIPFRELRFGNGDKQSWGIQIYRYIAEKNEEDYWTFWSKDEGGWVRHYGELIGLENIPRQRRIQVSPYITGQYNRAQDYVNPVHPDNYDLYNNIGADIKIGVTNNLTMDLTLNPDFGQVEADPAELNLSAFETYFSERRPFFMEGGNIFNFSLGLGDGDQSSNGLFYTRRMGRSPHHSFNGTDSSWVNTPSSTQILSAGKLSGKTTSGWSIGILDVVTKKEEAAIIYENGKEKSKTVEPFTNYFVSRVQKDFREGKTTIGGIFTSTNRFIDDDYLEYLHHDAYSTGIDVSHLFKDDKYTLEAAFATTDVLGAREAILETQTGSNHYFQRPDAKHLKIDSSATNLMGYAHKMALWKIKGDHWRWGLGEWTYSPGFEANDLGFNRKVDTAVQFFWLQYREDDPGKYVRRYSINYNIWQGKTFGNERTGFGGNINGSLTFMNYWSLASGFNLDAPANHLTVLWGGPSVRSDGSFNAWIWGETDSRKDLNFSMDGYRGSSSSGTNWSGGSQNITWRPTDFLSLKLAFGVQLLEDTWVSWWNYGPAKDLQTGEEYYLLAELDQKTIYSTIRVDLTLTPNLSLQFYGSPYVTAGRYFNFKQIVDPQAKSFDDRFKKFNNEQVSYNKENEIYEIDSDNDGITNFEFDNMDFNYKQYNSNLVLRWEYLTGSTLYLVWSQGMSDYISDGDFNFGRDIKNLFKVDSENILLIKVSYLMNI